jgi:hypothetical protein
MIVMSVSVARNGWVRRLRLRRPPRQVRPSAVAAVALVVPQGLIDRRAGRREEPVAEYMEDLAAIERRAIRAVVAAEQRLGRVP